MYLLLNNKEIAHFLVSELKFREAAGAVKLDLSELLNEIEEKVYLTKNTKNYLRNGFSKEFKIKITDRIRKRLHEALRRWRDEVNESIEFEKNYTFGIVHKNIEYFIEALGEDNILDLYKKSKFDNFVKSVGLQIYRDNHLIRRKNYKNYKTDCLVRNTVGNEDLLLEKIDNNFPFWFIDSGYTNFLETNKKWHRLVRNHLHYGKKFVPPCDRLDNFKSFPEPWRNNGDKILVVEPGPFAAGIFHVDLRTWRYDIEKEIRQYSDLRIVFREKMPKTERSNLYEHLLQEDYCCLVNINSNAATEAVWAGIPVITLDRHVTNPIAGSKISDLLHLNRPHLGEWLCMLSYSQFTYEELISGRAIELVKHYHV